MSAEQTADLEPFLAAIRAEVATLADAYDAPSYLMTTEPGGTMRFSVVPPGVGGSR